MHAPMSPASASSSRSPFFGRAYGSYTPAQIEAAVQLFRHDTTAHAFDPFAGVGGALPQLIGRRHSLLAIDANPVATTFLEMRRPAWIARLHQLDQVLTSVLNSVPRYASGSGFVEGWLSPSMSQWLNGYAEAVRRRARRAADPQIAIALLALPILAARQLVSFRVSDNAAWPKPGGLATRDDPRRLLRDLFVQWAEYLHDQYGPDNHGSLKVVRTDIRHWRSTQHFDILVTSPPYANRLDYLRMWAPELACLRAVTSEPLFSTLPTLIGTNVIRDSPVDPSAVRRLPKSVREALLAIRSDPAKASASYYYPFFANYAVQLHLALSHSAARVSPGGRGIVFIRDTPRKDVLFPASDVVVSALRSLGCNVLKQKSIVVRRHIGMRRRREVASLQGLAQREWWIGFER